MSWIKIRTNLATDPAISSIALRLKMPPRHVLGSLVAIWSWADALTADGFVSHASPSLIDELAGKKGFATAMQAVDWITLNDNGITFPRWDRHNGSSAKARSGEAERKQLQRSAQNATRHPAPHGQSSGHMSAECPDICPEPVRTIVATREEEIREEKKNTPKAPRKRGAGEAVDPASQPEGIRDRMLAVNPLMHRLPTTRWSAKEFTAFTAQGLADCPQPDFDAMLAPLVAFYCAEQIPDPKDKNDLLNYRRGDLGTLLNNWAGEIDKANRWLTSLKISASATLPPGFDANAPHAHTGGVPCALPAVPPAAT